MILDITVPPPGQEDPVAVIAVLVVLLVISYIANYVMHKKEIEE